MEERPAPQATIKSGKRAALNNEITNDYENYSVKNAPHGISKCEDRRLPTETGPFTVQGLFSPEKKKDLRVFKTVPTLLETGSLS